MVKSILHGFKARKQQNLNQIQIEPNPKAICVSTVPPFADGGGM